LWNPYESSGTPLIALVQPGALYPPNVALYTFLPPVLAFNLSNVLHLILLWFFAYKCLGEFGVGPIGAQMGALSLALSSFTLVHIGYVPIFNAVIWIPALFFCVAKWMRTGRWKYALWGGASVAMPLVAGWAQLLLLSSVFVTLYFLMNIARCRNRARLVAGMVLLFVIGASLTLPQAMLTLEFKSHTSLQMVDWGLFISGSYAPQLLIELLFPSFFGVNNNHFYPIPYWAPFDAGIMSNYVGILPLMLAMVGVRRWRSSALVRFSLVMMLLALLMAFGAHTPLIHVIYRLPVFKFFHDHWINLAFFAFSVAILAAVGSEELMATPVQARRRAWENAVPVLIIVAATLLLVNSRRLVRSFDQSISPFSRLEWPQYSRYTVKLNNPAIAIPILLILVSSVLFWCWNARRGSMLIARLAFLFIAVDLCFYYGSLVHQTSPGGPDRHAQAIIDSMREHTGQEPFRVMSLLWDDPYLTLGDHFLTPNANLIPRLEFVQGYEPFLAYPYADLIHLDTGGNLSEWKSLLVNHGILALLNVRYVLVPTNFLPELQAAVAPGTALSNSKLASSANLLSGLPNTKESFSLQSDGRNALGSPPLVIALERNSLYQFSFETRADNGQRGDLVGVLSASGHIRYCGLKGSMLLPIYQRCTCLYLTGDSRQQLTVMFASASPARVEVRDVSLQRIASLPWSSGTYRIAAQDQGLTLLENTDPLPRAFFVNTLRPVRSSGDARAQLWQMADPLDLRTNALIEDLQPGMPTSVTEGSVNRLEYAANSARLQVSCGGTCFLVLADAHSPEWRAYVDGHETKLYRADAVVRGIYVSSGQHAVEFRYEPHRLNLYLLIAALGLSVIAAGTYFESRTGTPGHPTSA
jgi:hypothetical protein